MKCKDCLALENITQGFVIIESFCRITANKCETGLEFKNDNDTCNRTIEDINDFINEKNKLEEERSCLDVNQKFVPRYNHR